MKKGIILAFTISLAYSIPPEVQRILEKTETDNNPIPDNVKTTTNQLKNEAPKGDSSGRQLYYNKIKPKTGDKKGVDETINKPLNSGKQLEVIGGQNENSLPSYPKNLLSNMPESGDVQLYCPSQDKAIEIILLPAGGGDYRVIVRQDMNLDGTFEYTFDSSSLNITVSGICSNGIVACKPEGSWTNCEYYYWDPGTSGNVTLVNTQDTSLLGGCFCSNNSCGVDISGAKMVAEYIAGGISQGVMRVKPQLMMSKGGFDATTMTFTIYGQDKENCNVTDYTQYGEKIPSQYYSSAYPSISIADVELQQGNDPRSPYAVVKKTMEYELGGVKFNQPKIVSCDVRNDVAVYTTDLYETCTQTYVDSAGETWCVADTSTYIRGGNHCGGNTCDDCYEPTFQHGGRYVCGESVCYVDIDGDTSCSTVCNQGDQWCENIKAFVDKNLNSSNSGFLANFMDIYEFGMYLSSGNLLRTEDVRDSDGTLIGRKEYYELLCPSPVVLSVQLKKNQKYGVLFRPSGSAGRTKGFWHYHIISDGNFISSNKVTKFNTCSPFEYFRPLGVALNNGEVHTAGGIQVAQSWTTNCGTLSCWSNYYPPSRMQIQILKSQRYTGDQVSLSQVNTCPSDPQCVIRNEWICDNTGQNCVQTIKDGIKTGSTASPICYTTNTQIAVYTVCAYGNRIEVRGNPDIYGKTFTGNEMWFWIKREMDCGNKEVDIDLTRPKRALETAKYDGSTGYMSYSHLDQSMMDISKNYNVPQNAFGTCPAPVCVVNYQEASNDVFADRTNRSQLPGGSTRVVREIRVCEESPPSSGSYTCPYDPNKESLEKPCACDEGPNSWGFQTSVSVLGAVIEASKDIICSTVGQ